MKFYSYDSVESTSDTAKELLREGKVPPFVVCAAQQSAGRGRSGKSWTSPEGNLYLSLVLPQSHFGKNNLSALPLATGIALCKFFEERFKIRLTLKWPNDILFGGRKLLGILVESSHTGDGWGDFILGLGVNIANSPLVPIQETVCLSELINLEKSNFDLSEFSTDLVASLSKYLAENWDVGSSYHAYGLEKNQPWTDQNGRLYLLDGISDSGSLVMRSNKKVIDLNSVNHNFRWVYQKKTSHTYFLVCADLGNTALKLAIYTNTGERKFYKRYLYDELDLIPLDFIKEKYKLPDDWPVHYVSVNSEKSKLFTTKLSEHSLTAASVPKRTVSVDLNSYPINQLGMDRLCLLEGIRVMYPGEEILCVSMGTATTIESLSDDGVYRGGYIGAGVRMKLDALHQNTGLLPHLKPDCLASLNVESEPLGKSTEQSLLKSVFFELVGLVEFSVSNINRKYKKKPRVVFTGGDGEVFAKYFKVDFSKDLVCKGIFSIVKGG